jgi:hypothetical protein
MTKFKIRIDSMEHLSLEADGWMVDQGRLVITKSEPPLFEGGERLERRIATFAPGGWMYIYAESEQSP